jgi:hypothetical protein
LSEISSSIPKGVNPHHKVLVYPTLTVNQWNIVVDVLTAEELSAVPNEEALIARDTIRNYLVDSGYRRSDAP